MLIFKAYVSEEFNTRSIKSDRRKKCNRYIVSYFDESGYEYRKGFEFPIDWNNQNCCEHIPQKIDNFNDTTIYVHI